MNPTDPDYLDDANAAPDIDEIPLTWRECITASAVVLFTLAIVTTVCAVIYTLLK